MSWPMSQDFNEAVQNPRLTFTDPDLKFGETVVGAHGMPLPRSGNFADVYQLRGADGREWAVKCFTRPVTGLGDRYAAISKALVEANFPFSVGFEFLAEGIQVGGIGRPVVKMEWVEGLLLNQVVRENAGRPTVLAALGQMWVKLCKRLRDAGVAHADLQHGNVLLVPGSRAGAYGLKLIDYDGMYVPALANSPSGESGHPSYQHPNRAKTRAYSPDVDRFPHLVVATALKGLAVCGPELWEKYDNGDNLLFTEDDFRKPAESKVMQELWRTEDSAVQAFVGRLAIACGRAIPQTPWLDQLAPDGDAPLLDDNLQRDAAAMLGIPIPVSVAPPPSPRSAVVMPSVAPRSPTSEPLFETFDPNAFNTELVVSAKRPANQRSDVELVDEQLAAEKKGKPKKSRKKEKASSRPMLIAGGVLFLVVGVAGAVLMTVGKPKPDSPHNKTDDTKNPGKKDQISKVGPVGPINPGKQKDPELLSRQVPVVALELLDDPYPKTVGFAAINGWRKRGADLLPMVLSNASDKPSAIPEAKDFQVSPHAVAVHPLPKEFVAVAWKSPIEGSVRIGAKVTHLDRGGGNGVAWWLEHRSANRAVIFSEGILDVGGEAQTPPRTLKVDKEDVIILVVDAKNENHFNDMTEVALTITETERQGRVWNLAADVAETIGEGNPHADKHGNRATWSFLRSGPPTPGSKPRDPPPQPGEMVELKAKWSTPLKAGKYSNIARIDSRNGLALLASPPFAALDLATGQARRGYAAVKGGVIDVYPLDGGRVGTRGLRGESLNLWDAKTGQEVGTVAIPDTLPRVGADPNTNIVIVSLAPNAKYVAVGRGGILVTQNHPDLPFRVFDTTTQKAVLSIDWKGGASFFSADSSRILVAEWTGRNRWFKLPSGEADGNFDLSGASNLRHHRVSSISADGSVIGYNGPAGLPPNHQGPAILDGRTGQVKHSFAKEYYYMSSVGVSADGRRAAMMRAFDPKMPGTSAYDVIDIASGVPIGRCRVASGQTLPSYGLSADGGLLFLYNPQAETALLFEVPASSR